MDADPAAVGEFPALLDFTGLKKKKKSKVPKDENAPHDNFSDKVTYNPLDSVTESKLPDGQSDTETDLSFDLTKKKKRKKPVIHEWVANVEVDIKTVVPAGTDALVICLNEGNSDYAYEDLLLRAFAIIRNKDPNWDAESKRKLVMKPPQIIRIGTKKSSFVNFLEICKALHRTPQHLQSFLLVELGTTGSVDGNNQLLIKGRFEQRQIENVLRHYIKEYVTCHTCRSPETVLQKDTRLFFLQCESCGSRCSVAGIKAGFQAVTNKRAAMRAKAT